MPPKHRGPSTPAAASASAYSASHTTSSAASAPVRSSTSTSCSTSSKPLNANTAQEIVQGVWDKYVQKTPQRVKLLDCFMTFLVVVGALQFLYCVIAGNFPFNAFLAGFSATVGQFVLTASLRIQTNPENKAEFESISNERAFADFIFGSLLLHFFCVNFIN
ncbi:defender against death DAD protein [Glonium stellatum]|uniref:Dolichyl-diphosphooligosaccharide--protein glycosyltransferase subunit OST2 n=1 Tax=Glonium stellatum TaxID=574774 RepID=A0A8E2JNE1_9PEZI|nr:defender against death DAD protein [Glonium stellatum]